MIALLTNKYVLGFAVAIAVFLSVLAYGSNQYSKGYKEAELKSQVEMLEFKNKLALETTETIKRTQLAASKANEIQKQQINELQAENDKLEEIQKANENEANNDTNSNRIGLDSSSVLRLNKIK